MWLVHIFFWVCVLIIVMSAYYWIRLARGNPERGPNGEPLPWWSWATFMGLGVLGVVGSAPGLFFDDPNWFTDKLYWVVERLIG